MGSNTKKKAKKPKAHCQCYNEATKAQCEKNPISGSLFCETHQQCPGSPLSGYEPNRDVELYNQPNVCKSHNCYSYAMHVYDPKGEQLCKNYGNCRNFFHQPGAKTGQRNALNKEERRSCPVVEELMMGDIPEVRKSTFTQKCPRGSSKVAAVVDKGNDYHWYRQDRDGLWSHKDGSNKVKTYDSLKRPIFNPKFASRNYRWQGSDLNYEDFCGFYCVPRDHQIVLGRGANGPRPYQNGPRNAAAAARKGRTGRQARKSQQARKTYRKSRHSVGGGYDVRLDALPPEPPRSWLDTPEPAPQVPLYGLAPPYGFGFAGNPTQAILRS